MTVTLTHSMASGYYSRESVAIHHITRAVLKVRRVRVGTQEHARCAETPCSQCYAVVSRRVRQAMTAPRFRMVIPAFPFKFPNPAVTFADTTGGTADWSEIVSLDFLAGLVEEARVVRPEATLVLALDGRLFEDLITRLWPDFGPQHVDAYAESLRRQIVKRGWNDLFEVRCLDDYYTGSSAQMRQRILEQWAVHPTEEDLYQSLMTSPECLADYVGIKRFIEDDGALSPVYAALNRSAKRDECRRFALGVLHRSAAWTRMIATEFPDTLRLSIHQWWPHNACKVGIYLAPGLDNRVSPWRGVGLYDRANKTWKIVKRQEAEATGATLAWQDGMPFYRQ